MIKFLGRLAVFAFFVLGIVGLTLWACVAYERIEVNRVYDVQPGVDVLFLGSSQIGCSVVEQKKFHNFVLWSSRRSHYSFLARLLELERRNALDQIKTCVVYFNPLIIHQQTAEVVNLSWWNDFYLGWDVAKLYPTTFWSKLLYACSNLTIPMGFSVCEQVPGGRFSIATHDTDWKKTFYDEITGTASSLRFEQLVPGWEAATRQCYLRILEICQQHGIRCVFIDFPMLNEFRKNFPRCYLEKHCEMFEWLRLQGAECIKLDKFYGEDYYFDNVHMVEPMSELYTRDLYQRLKLPILERCN